MGVNKKKRIKKEYIPVFIAVILFIGLIAALIAVLLYKPKEEEVAIDPNQHVQEELELDNANSSCKKDTLDELYKLANKVTVDTKIVERKMSGNDQETNEEVEISYFIPEFTFANVDDKLYLNITRDFDSLNKDLTPENGKIVYECEWSDSMVTYTIEVKSNGDCKGETVRKFTVVTPIYNSLSDYEICTIIPEFKYCQKYVMEDIPTFNEFYTMAQEYIKDHKITTTMAISEEELEKAREEALKKEE